MIIYWYFSAKFANFLDLCNDPRVILEAGQNNQKFFLFQVKALPLAIIYLNMCYEQKTFIFETKVSDVWGCFKGFIEVWYLDDKFLIWHPVLDYSMGYCDGDTNVTYIFLTFTTDTVWRWWLYWKCHIIAVALDVLCSVCNSYLDLANLIEVWKKENDKLIERHFKDIRCQNRRRICDVVHYPSLTNTQSALSCEKSWAFARWFSNIWTPKISHTWTAG